jgi:hypothetical protein
MKFDWMHLIILFAAFAAGMIIAAKQPSLASTLTFGVAS